MSYIKFLDNDDHFQGIIKVIDEHTVEVRNCFRNLSGFQLFTDSDFMFGDYSKFNYDYEEPIAEENVYKYTDDGHKWCAPKKTITFACNVDGGIKGELVQHVYNYEEIEIPSVQEIDGYKFIGWRPNIPLTGAVDKDETYMAEFEQVESIESVRERKIKQMNDVQQDIIQNGFDVQFGDVSKHFTLTDHDQTSMLGLMGQVQMGMEYIPWHTSDHDEHCEYFTNEQMQAIITKAMSVLTYNITYYRDLRIYINNLQDAEEIENIEYGVEIPDEYKSDVLKDLEKKMNNFVEENPNKEEKTNEEIVG